MPSYRIQFQILPAAPFGLPDGDKVVLPAGPRSIAGPVIDTRTGVIANHGTLPVYRTEEQALALDHSVGQVRLEIRDNFGSLWIASDSLEFASRDGRAVVERLCRSLSTIYGLRFSAELQFIEDADGVPRRWSNPQFIQLGSFVTFNLEELSTNIRKALGWAELADSTVQKALLYAEHACLLNEYAASDESFSVHAAFSRSLAFLQLFKALTTILGDPSSDRDHQSRFRTFGLPADFWERRVKPLYKIRNDSDVAHYSIDAPDPLGFATTFGHAVVVLREALDAHVSHISVRSHT